MKTPSAREYGHVEHVQRDRGHRPADQRDHEVPGDITADVPVHVVRRGNDPRPASRRYLTQRHARDRRQLVQQEQGQEEDRGNRDGAPEHGAGCAEDDARQRVQVLLGLIRDMKAVVEPLDGAVVLGVGDRLGQPGRELIDLGHEGRHERRNDCDEADHECQEDDGRRGPAADARLQALDERIEGDREEEGRQRPDEDVAHTVHQACEHAQREQADHDLGHGAAGHVDPQRPARGAVGAALHGFRRSLVQPHGRPLGYWMGAARHPRLVPRRRPDQTGERA